MTLKEYIVYEGYKGIFGIKTKAAWESYLQQCDTRKIPDSERFRIITTFNADEQLQEEKGLRWVKASEKMPSKEGRTVVKRLGEAMIADAALRKNGIMVFATPNGMTWAGYKDFEWLDEETEPGQPVPAGEVLPRSIEEMIAKEPVTFFLANALKYLDENQKIALRDALIERTPKQDNQ